MSRQENISVLTQSLFTMGCNCPFLFCFSHFRSCFTVYDQFCFPTHSYFYWVIRETILPVISYIVQGLSDYKSSLMVASYWKKKILKGNFSPIFSVCLPSRVHTAHLPAVSLNFHPIHHMQEIQGFPRSLDPSSLLHVMLLVCFDSPL